MNLLKTQKFEKSCLKKVNNTFLLTIYTKPNSKKLGVTEITEEYVAISINAPPVEGKANSAIIEFLADSLDLSKSCLQLEKGGKNKNKIVSISDSGYTEEEILNKLKKQMI